MKTFLPDSITTIDDAKKFLKELNDNGEAYHPDDNAADIITRTNKQLFTKEESMKLDKLMDQVLAIDGFDAYSFLLELDDTISE